MSAPAAAADDTAIVSTCASFGDFMFRCRFSQSHTSNRKSIHYYFLFRRFRFSFTDFICIHIFSSPSSSRLPLTCFSFLRHCPVSVENVAVGAGTKAM